MAERKGKTVAECQSTYVDNGYTGTDFDRPGFMRLMDDVRTGKIQCIVVKDLSRFGRNAIETGYYIETMVNDVEFLMSFAKTVNAVNKLLNGDKVKFYGNLLKNGYLREREKIEVDEFEEYLELIDSLSFRELEYLSFFQEFSDKHSGRLVYQNWKEFSKEFRGRFPNRNVDFVFKRLQRTGFISEVIETEDIEGEMLSLDINSIGFETEAEFYKFNELVLKNY